MRRHEIEIELRGQKVVIEFSIQDRDPDVGLMGYGFEEETIFDEDGNELVWELTNEEIERVGDKVHKYACDQSADDYC